MVVALDLPPPQPGRRSRSSGRAVPRTRSGDVRSPSRRGSRRSRAGCRRPSADPRRRARADAARRAPRRSAATPRTPRRVGRRRAPPPRSSPTSGRSWLSTQRASLASGTRSDDGLDELGLGGLRGVGLEDARLRLDHLRQRPEGDAFAVRQRAALAPEDEPVRIRVDRLRELPDQPALADARHADEGDELRRPLPLDAREGLEERVELLARARRAAPRRAGATSTPKRARAADRLPHRDRLRLPLRLDRLAVAVLDRPLGRAVGRLADEDAVHRRGRLQTGGRVDDVARDHALALRRVGRRARRRASPVLTAMRTCRSSAGLASFSSWTASRDRERSAHRTLGIVLVRDRRAEDGHDRVADELLHGAAEALDLRAQRARSRERASRARPPDRAARRGR